MKSAVDIHGLQGMNEDCLESEHLHFPELIKPLDYIKCMTLAEHESWVCNAWLKHKLHIYVLILFIRVLNCYFTLYLIENMSN